MEINPFITTQLAFEIEATLSELILANTMHQLYAGIGWSWALSMCMHQCDNIASTEFGIVNGPTLVVQQCFNVACPVHHMYDFYAVNLWLIKDEPVLEVVYWPAAQSARGR